MASPGPRKRAALLPRRGPEAAGLSLAVPTVAGKIQVGQYPSFVEVAPNGKFAYITDVGAKAITVLDTVTDKVSKTIPIPEGPPSSSRSPMTGKRPT